MITMFQEFTGAPPPSLPYWKCSYPLSRSIRAKCNLHHNAHSILLTEKESSLTCLVWLRGGGAKVELIFELNFPVICDVITLQHYS